MGKCYLAVSRFAVISALLCGTMIAPTSCVSEEYDLNKELDLNMSVGGSIALPLGFTEKLLLGDMIEEDELETIFDENGNEIYQYSMSDNIHEEFSDLPTDPLSFSIPTQSETIKTEINIPTLDPVSLSFNSQGISLNDGSMGKVDTGEPIPFSQKIDLSPNISISSIPGYYIDNLEIPLSCDSDPVAINLGSEINCPDEILNIKDITFGSANGDVIANVVFDVSAIYNRFTASSFSMILPYVEITFPEGFILDNGDNVIRKENLTNNGSEIRFTFTINKYDFGAQGGLLEDINGYVTSEIADHITVSGTTSGATVSDNTLSLNVDSQIAVKDMTLTVAQVEYDIEDMTGMCDASKIEISNKSITAVESIALGTDNGTTNAVNISISPVKSILDVSANSNPLTLKFPRDKFVIAQQNGVRLVGSNYELEIPFSSIISGAGFDADIVIEQILFDGDIKEQGGMRYLEFNPEISIEGSTIYLGEKSGSELTLSSYNDFAATSQEIITAISADNLGIESAVIETSGYDLPIEKSSSEINLSEEIPVELSRLDRITFSDEIFLTVDITVDLAGVDGDLSFDDYTVDFPKFIKFADNVGVDSNNSLVINDSFSHVGNGLLRFNKSYEIESIDLESYEDICNLNSDGTKRELRLNENISFEGGLRLGSCNIDSSEIDSEVSANVSFSISDMKVAKVYGFFEPEIPALEDEFFDLTELTEEIGDGEIKLALSDPRISLDITNSIDIPIQIDELRLTPYKGGEPQSAIVTSTPVVIEPAVEGVAATSSIVVATKDIENGEAGVQYVTLENFNSILLDMPDSVKMSYSVKTVERNGHSHMIDLSRDFEEDPYFFDVDYALDVPLSFEEFSIDYTAEVDDLGLELEEVVKYLSSLELDLEVENTLPLALTISEIIPRDADGDVLSGLGSLIDSKANTINANGKSTIKVSLKDSKDSNGDSDLCKLDALDIKISAQIDGASSLSPDQYIRIGITARIPEGITFDANEL